MIQTSTKLPDPKRESAAIPAIRAGATKMPLPIIDPMMIMVASSNPSRLVEVDKEFCYRLGSNLDIIGIKSALKRYRVLSPNVKM